VGRSVKVKKKILADILGGLSKGPGLNPEKRDGLFQETLWRLVFGGGRLLHA